MRVSEGRENVFTLPSVSRFKVAIKREQNKFIYYVERKQLRQSQDREAGLKRKTNLIARSSLIRSSTNRSPLIHEQFTVNLKNKPYGKDYYA